MKIYKISQNEGELKTKVVRFKCPITGVYIDAYKTLGSGKFDIFEVYAPDQSFVDSSEDWFTAKQIARTVRRDVEIPNLGTIVNTASIGRP